MLNHRGSYFCVLLSAVVLASCAPQRLQTAQFVDYDEGKPVYHMTGYTDAGDIAPNASAKYIENALSDACPGGVKIKSLEEYLSHNAVAAFLYWKAVAGCKN